MGLRGRGTLRTANSRIVADTVTGEINPVQGPDFSEEYRNTEKRKQLMMNAIDGLKKLGDGAIQGFEKHVAKPAAEIAAAKGAAEAAAGMESTASWSMLTGSSQQDAFNKVASRVEATKLPDAYMVNYSQRAATAAEAGDTNFKPLEYMSEEERRADYAKFKSDFIKNFEKQPYFADLSVTADSIMDKHLTKINEQVRSERERIAKNAVGSEATQLIEALSGEGNEAVDKAITAKMGQWIAAAGGTSQANESIINRIASLGAGLDDGKPKTALANYLQSPEARNRFGAMEGFDKVVKQVREANIKYERAELKQRQNSQEMNFYAGLQGGEFDTQEEIRSFLGQTVLSEKKKFDLLNKGTKFLESKSGARQLDGAIRAGQAEVVNAAKPQVLESAFTMHVGSQEDMNLANLSAPQRLNLIQWLESGYNLPSFVTEFGATTYDNGTAGQLKLQEQRNLYSDLKATSGSLVSKIFAPEVQAKLDMYTRIQNDSSMTPQEIKNTLDGFDAAWRKDATGASANMEIRQELKEKDMSKKLLSFSKDNSLQPWFTFSDADASSQEWAKNEVSEAYRAYRLSGLPQEQALDRAQNDFVASNQWVTFRNGAEVYIPANLGSDFVNRSTKFLNDTGVINAIAVKYAVTPEEVETKLVVRPASDYNITRQLEVVYNGTVEDYRFNKIQFDNNSELLDQEQRAKVAADVSKMFSDPEFIEQRKRINKILKIRGDLGLLGR